MSTEEKLLEIEEWIGKRTFPPVIEVDEAVDIIHKHMQSGLTYGLIKGRMSTEAKVMLSRYNIEIQTETYTAGHNSSVTNTLHWTFKHKQNGNKENPA